MRVDIGFGNVDLREQTRQVGNLLYNEAGWKPTLQQGRLETYPTMDYPCIPAAIAAAVE